MKCKYCDGTGTSNWCVNGTFINCPHCGGTGEVEQTNEEWLRQANTEELAEFIRKQRDDWSDGWYSDCHRFEEIVKWLKEIHK